jgi:importin subunit beta-1
MRKEDCAAAGGAVMKLVLKMFGTQAAAENSVQEDALMLVGALSDQLEESFEVYVPPVKGYLLHGISNSVEVETCKICIGVVGDLYRNLGQKSDGSGSPMMKDTTEVITALLTTFHKAGVDETIKPHILSCFGDIAMAIGGAQFVNYAKQVMEAINQATVTSARSTESEDFDVIDEINDLRDGCLEAYVGILIALQGNPQPGQPPHANVQLFFPVCEHIIGFIMACLRDKEVSDKVVGSAIGLVGDMIDTYKQPGPDGRPLASKFLSQQFCQGLITIASQSDVEATQKLCPWVKQLMQKVGIQLQGF